MYFESHAHYDDEAFDSDRDSLLPLLLAQGVDRIVNIGADLPSSQKSIALCEQYPFIYAAVGVHPHEAQSLTEESFLELEKLASHPKVVAIGEIGLDYYYDNSPRALQRQWFIRQLELAEKLNLPVVIHSRQASEESFEIIRKSGVRRGIIHCYSGSAEMARDYAKMGFLIGVGGVLTFKNAKKLAQSVQEVGLSHIVIETDSPYLSPVPHRGERNDSRNLFFIAEALAKTLDISHLQVANQTFENADALFFPKK